MFVLAYPGKINRLFFEPLEHMGAIIALVWPRSSKIECYTFFMVINRPRMSNCLDSCCSGLGRKAIGIPQKDEAISKING